MSLVFVHTSDWHLGREMRRIGPRAAESRGWRFEAVRRVFQCCIDRKAAFLLVAGDVFQSETPTGRVIDEAVGLFKDAPVPTVVIPGNHDPFREGSLWTREDFAGRLRGLANVRLALDPTPMEIADGAALLFPAPVTDKFYPDDWSATMPTGVRGGDRFRIGLAHGVWQGYDGQRHNANFIAADRTERSGLDYLAMGDLHSYTLPDHPAAKARARYCGAPECAAIDEERSGHALIVSIDRPGAEPIVEPVRVGKLKLHRVGPLELAVGQGVERLVAALDGSDDASDVLLSLELRGVVGRGEKQMVDEWLARRLSTYLGSIVDDSALVVEPSEEDWKSLSLDKAEMAVRSLLEDSALAEQLGLPADHPIRHWASDAAVRRAAINRFYASLLRESSR